MALKEIVRKASGLKEKKDRVEGTRKERARRVAEGKQALQLAFAVGHSSSLAVLTLRILTSSSRSALWFGNFRPEG